MTGEILRQEGLEAEIDCFENGQALLDVMLEGMNGMTLASILRRQGRTQPIVLVSNNRDMALRGYEVGAARYLVKPLDAQKLRETLLYCFLC